MIDTLKFARHMQEKGGMSQVQAEALAEGIRDASLEQLATKRDLTDVATASKRDLDLAVSTIKNYILGGCVSVVLALGILQHYFK